MFFNKRTVYDILWIDHWHWPCFAN